MGSVLQSDKPHVLCIDVGGPTNIGWADSEGQSGSGADLDAALDGLSKLLRAGRPVALGFEAPIWTPARDELARITGRRGGVETTYNRPWAAGAGTGALGASLALMPWCLTRIANGAGRVATTVDPQRFIEGGGLFLWEAFVSGGMKAAGTTHHDDARLACEAFVARWPHLRSDIPGEPALNHAVSSAMAAGLSIRQDELVKPAIVVGVLADLYPGYQSQWINTSAGRIFARVGGKGPPLLLLHGFSETHVMWHLVAPLLADAFTLIIADLPGYGWSDMPESDPDHTPYSKRAMAKTLIEAMEQLGHVRFALAGHDRGGRVAYRLALDHPGRLSRLAVLDILPTYDYWARINRLYALKIYHWTFLAQPFPLPETLIGGHPDFFLRQKMASQTKSKTLDAIDPRALEHYLAAFRDPSRVHAMCEDYRAGATVDFEIDEADRGAGHKITIPMLALWGDAGIASAAATPLDTWKMWATDVSGQPVDSGHFLTEENPDATANALKAFFGGT